MDDDLAITIDNIFSNILYPTPRIYLGGKLREFQLDDTQDIVTSFFDDFLALTIAPGYGWNWQGTKTNLAAQDGRIRIAGDGANNAAMYPSTQDIFLPYAANQSPKVEARCGPSGANNTIQRFVGLAGNGINGGPPANGIYFRFTSGGNFIGVCRSSNNETGSTVDTAVASNNGTYRKLSFEVKSAGTQVEFFVDGVSKGNVSSNIPSAAMHFFFGSNSVSASEGLNIDYALVKQSRSAA